MVPHRWNEPESLEKSNQGSIFKRFRDLVVGVMPEIDPNNEKQDNIKKNQTNKSE